MEAEAVKEQRGRAEIAVLAVRVLQKVVRRLQKVVLAVRVLQKVVRRLR
jgi:hypothetical protein